jgi:hypothetical protein
MEESMLEAAPIRHAVKLDDIPADGGLDAEFEVGAAERGQIAKRLDLAELKSLRLSFHLEHLGRGRASMRGTLEADLVQTCVVTLEPVPAAIREEIALEFWPERQLAEREEQIDDPQMHRPVDWPEPIRNGYLDLGPLTYETLATAIDPYPRKKGAVLEWRETGEEPPHLGPFSALSRLRPR